MEKEAELCQQRLDVEALTSRADKAQSGNFLLVRVEEGAGPSRWREATWADFGKAIHVRKSGKIPADAEKSSPKTVDWYPETALSAEALQTHAVSRQKELLSSRVHGHGARPVPFVKGPASLEPQSEGGLQQRGLDEHNGPEPSVLTGTHREQTSETPAWVALRFTTVSDLQAAVAVVNQEVLLEPQLPSLSCAMDQRHPGRDFLPCLVCVVQKRPGAVEGHRHLVFTAKENNSEDTGPSLR
ncbi:hypothetical protein EYF80_001499 [Liparis tanakae]|uniref:Uncharacterized protein n=1 Tax=Liparis tanakae TaxID=230148 RepID=A0A4Z2JER9_9TELE|nr:hypothetical protein EYF80_001499 [Liparis tanakae]